MATRSKAMTPLSQARWAFNMANWSPTHDQLNLAVTCIQSEEKERILRFHYQNDFKASLIGRLLIRKFVHLTTATPYEQIKLSRDDKGKPILTQDLNVAFNVSHQGQYIVLAGSKNMSNIGVDVMKIEPPANKVIQEFFRVMKRQFSTKEWEQIRNFSIESDQIASFYRHWCLKESYVKNIGVGITVKLSDLSFEINTRKLTLGSVCTDTRLVVQGSELKNWTFEECLLDEKHCCAVAYNSCGEQPQCFQEMSFEELMSEAKPFNAVDESFAHHLFSKDVKEY